MNAHEIIESYVTDVIGHLPAKQRADVAAELRSLLTEDLGGGDAAAALALVRRFGRPGEVAARYHMPYTLIDPADTRSFVIAAVAGAMLVPSTNPRLPVSTDPDTALLMVLAWLGVLVVYFALKSGAMRRWPDSFQWQASPLRTGATTPLAQAGLIALLVALGVFYGMPGPVAHVLSGGWIDAGTLAYSQDFQSPLRMLWFPVLLAVLIVLRLTAAIAGRWTAATKYLEIAFLLCAGLQLGWHAAYGNVFANATADHDGRLAMQLAGAMMIIVAAVEAWREWGRIPPMPPTLTAAA